MKEKKVSLKLVEVSIPILKFCLNSIETNQDAFKHLDGMLLAGRNYSFDSWGHGIKYGLLQSCFLLKVYILESYI